MNDPVTARDVMNRSYVGVNEADTVAGAARLMREEGVDGAVVLRGRDPVGMLAAEHVVDLVASDRDPADTSVDEVMSDRLPTVAADHRFADAATSLAESDGRHMLVMDNGDIAGVISEHDVVAAQTMLTAGPSEGTASIPQEVEPGFDPEAVSTQGVCEICGSLSQDLVELNGQVVCPACRDV